MKTEFMDFLDMPSVSGCGDTTIARGTLKNAIVDHECHNCGKQFGISRIGAGQYVYKKHYGTQLKWFCSWTCYCEGKRKRKNENHERRINSRSDRAGKKG